MKFVYKIYSPYDGFTPSEIPERTENEILRLGGWKRYMDVIEEGWECWVYFHGGRTHVNGVYAEGFVHEIDFEEKIVYLKLRKYSAHSPIKSQEICERVAQIVKPRRRQAFGMPEDFDQPTSCDTNSCKQRQCNGCETFRTFSLIAEGEWRPPRRLKVEKSPVVIAYWIEPTQQQRRNIRTNIKQLTYRFKNFKFGQMAYAYPFALAIFEKLRVGGKLKFDFIVPIPLSPDKQKKGEEHRTRKLAEHLGYLLSIPVKELLSLTTPISRRQFKQQGFSHRKFEACYLESLEVASRIPENTKILLVDDVITNGSTISMAVEKILSNSPYAEITIAAVGQMLIKEATVDRSAFYDS